MNPTRTATEYRIGGLRLEVVTLADGTIDVVTLQTGDESGVLCGEDLDAFMGVVAKAVRAWRKGKKVPAE